METKDDSAEKEEAWSSHEDEILLNYVQVRGEGNWRNLPKRAGTYITYKQKVQKSNYNYHFPLHFCFILLFSLIFLLFALNRLETMW